MTFMSWMFMTFHDIPWHSITPVRITYHYPGKRPQTVWGSGRTMYDDDDDDDDDDGDGDGDGDGDDDDNI